MLTRPRSLVVVAFLGASLLVSAWPVQAQDPAAPSPSPTANILYAHHHDSDTEELSGWMNTLVTDPTGNDIALGPQDQPLPSRVYTFTLAPAMSAPFSLDPTGNIVIDAYIGAGGSQGFVRVATEVRYGGEVVATGATQNHVYQQAGTAAYPKLTWTLAPAITEFAPGNDLVWTVTISGVAGQTVFMSVSAERGSSGLTLPVLSGGGSPPPPAGNETGNSTTNSTASTTVSSSNSTSGSASATPASRSTTMSSSAGGTTTGNGTATNGTADGSKDSPAPPLAFAGLAVLIAAIAVRRRLR